MEFRRMRRVVRTASRSRSMSGAIGWMLLVSVLIVYLIGISSAGTWISEHLIAPVFLRIQSAAQPVSGKTPDAQSPSEPAQKSDTVLLPALTCHTLQMGIYADRANADAQAAELKKLGAGGYIVEDGGRFRVLAAGYMDADSLKSVRTQLAADGFDSAGYLIETRACKLRVSASEASLAALTDAVAFLYALPQELSELSITFDKKQQSVVVGRSALSLLEAEAEGKRTAFETLPIDAGTPELYAVEKALLAMHERFTEALADPDAGVAAFSSSLKYTQLASAAVLYELSNTISGIS